MKGNWDLTAEGKNWHNLTWQNFLQIAIYLINVSAPSDKFYYVSNYFQISASQYVNVRQSYQNVIRIDNKCRIKQMILSKHILQFK